DLGQAARTPLLDSHVSHVGHHRRLLRTHVTKTYEGPESVANVVGRRVAYLTQSVSLVIGPELDGDVFVVAKVVGRSLEDTERTVLPLSREELPAAQALWEVPHLTCRRSSRGDGNGVVREF